MKKTILLFSVCMAVIFFTQMLGQVPKTCDVTVFLVDRYMHRLIPIKHSIPASTPQNQAEEIIKIICMPIKQNSSFTQYTTTDKIKVKIQGETAIVDLPEAALINIPTDRENQQMFIYQIVNSLCSVPEIEYVRFTIEGKTDENYFAFADIREIFSSNYEL